MKAIKTATKFLSRPQVWMILFLCFYVVCGFYTELKLIIIKPLPSALMQDFKIYEQAFSSMIHGGDPYRILNIGHGYLYPPSALFIVAVFSGIRSLPLQVSLYSTLNVILLVLMVYGVAKHYDYSNAQVGFWYVICLGFAPFLELLTIGQINVITLFGIFMLFLWADSLPILGGSGLALATLTKVSPALFFVYLFANKRWKTMAAAIAVIILITGLSILCFGLDPVLKYPSVFQWLTNQFPLGTNSQSLAARLAGLQSVVASLPENLRFQSPVLDFFATNYPLVQHILTIYIAVVVLVSNALLLFGKQAKEPAFIITTLGMMLSPNVMWYHHYVFMLLPLLIWMGWSRLDGRVIAWCLAGLLVAQMDRWFLPYGLLIHVFGHLSILMLLFYQVREFIRSRNRKAYLVKTGLEDPAPLV